MKSPVKKRGHQNPNSTLEGQLELTSKTKLEGSPNRAQSKGQPEPWSYDKAKSEVVGYKMAKLARKRP